MPKQLSVLMQKKEVSSKSSQFKTIAIRLMSVSKAISLFSEMLRVISIWKIFATWESLNDRAETEMSYQAKLQI